MDQQQSIALHSFETDLGGILPADRAARNALGLFGEGSFREQIGSTHGAGR
jgi:hypothetical protein